jgi:hypothetical protein
LLSTNWTILDLMDSLRFHVGNILIICINVKNVHC